MSSGIMRALVISFIAAELYQVLAFGVIGEYPYMWAHAVKSAGWAVLGDMAISKV